MEVTFSNSFKKSFKQRIQGYNKEPEFYKCLEIFITTPFDPVLKTHKLSGKLKNFWSFTIAFDLRVVFYFTNDKPKRAVLVDIGNHKEVY